MLLSSTSLYPRNLFEDIGLEDFYERDKAQARDALNRALSKLTERESVVVRARYATRMRFNEINETYGFPGSSGAICTHAVGELKRTVAYEASLIEGNMLEMLVECGYLDGQTYKALRRADIKCWRDALQAQRDGLICPDSIDGVGIKGVIAILDHLVRAAYG